MSDSLQPHGLQHARPPCPSPTPGVYPNSCPLCRWCHLTISSSVIPFSSHLQSFPASGSFPMSQFFASGGHSIGVSASTSVLPMNIQDWSPLGWTGWISLQPKGLSRVFSNPQFKSINSLVLSLQPSHPYMTTEKTIALTRGTFVDKVMSLLFNMLSRLVIDWDPDKNSYRDSRVVQWSVHWATTAGGPGTIPGQGTKMTHAVQHVPFSPPKNGYRIYSIVIQSCSCGRNCWWE